MQARDGRGAVAPFVVPFARASCRRSGAPSVTAPTGFGETPATPEDRDTILVMQLDRDTMKLTGQTANSWFRAKIFPVFRAKIPCSVRNRESGCNTLELLHELELKIAKTAEKIVRFAQIPC
jgi:hypothetical protein